MTDLKSSLVEYVEERIEASTINKASQKFYDLEKKLERAKLQIAEAREYDRFFRRIDSNIVNEAYKAMCSLEATFANYIRWEKNRFDMLKTNTEKLHGVAYFEQVCNEFSAKVDVVNNATNQVIKTTKQRMVQVR